MQNQFDLTSASTFSQIIQSCDVSEPYA